MTRYSSEELATWSGGQWLAEPGLDVSGVCKDSRTISRGDLYVALRGERLDGHRFCKQALEAGAAACVVDREFAGVDLSGPYLVVEDTTQALSDLASGYRSQWSGAVVGVTGSCGKTTVKEWTAGVLSPLGPVGKTQGNYNNEIGLPVSMLSAERSQKVGVYEVGMNHPGELRPLCEWLKPDVGIITSVGAGHLGQFQSVRDIAVEKSEMFRVLESDGVALAHRDNPYLDVLKSVVPCELRLVGVGGEADLVATRFDSDRVEFFEAVSGDSGSLPLPQPGEHSVVNVLFAAQVGRLFDLSWEQIADGLGRVESLSMRWEISELAGVSVVNDAYNANPESMRASVTAFSDGDSTGSRWVVLGGMRELGAAAEEAHRSLGAWLTGRNIDGLVLVGPDAAVIADGIDGESRVQVAKVDDTTSAAEFLLGVLVSGDNVLLKGSRGERIEDVLAALAERVGDGGWRS